MYIKYILIGSIPILIIQPMYIQQVLAQQPDLPDYYSINGDYRDPTYTAYFDLPGSQTTIFYYYNGIGTPDISGADEFTAIRNAFTTWQNDPASYVSFTDGGTTVYGASLANDLEHDAFDGRNVLQWVRSWPGQGLDVVAETFLWPIPEQTTGNPPTTEFDIVFDEDYTWCICSTVGQYDVESIALHEIGHVLTLYHVDNDSSIVMYKHVSDGSLKRSLHYGDRAGVRYIYADTNTAGSSVGTETQGADIAAGTVNDGSTVDYVLAWADNHCWSKLYKVQVWMGCKLFHWRAIILEH
ncbi:MAG: matrixin family metalloprotease [Candidatus Nitrosocaldus sp.]|nr:matrixin family metalloprotease [Candidatus Nitrosocaldus sp.]MDW8000023.1 matrixin family metalloprotease [Candidatus Nitrosocaldus sp.]